MNFMNTRTITPVLAAIAAFALCGAMADDGDNKPTIAQGGEAVAEADEADATYAEEDEEEPENLDNMVEERAKEDVAQNRQGVSYVTVAPGLKALQAANAVVQMMSPPRRLRTDLLTPEELETLTVSDNKYSTDKEKPWRTVFNEILRPFAISSCENDDEIVLGSPDAINAFIHARAITTLADNHEMLMVDFAGGWPINEALGHLADLAGFDINYDYMEEKYRTQATREEIAEQQAAQSADASKPEAQKTAAQGDAPAVPQVVTTYSNKVPMEWRYIMHEILDPIGYTFVEENGIVRPMSLARQAQYEQDKINAKPLETKVVTLHHVRAERVVELLCGNARGQQQQQTPSIIRHKNGFIKVVTEDKDRTKMFSGSVATVSSGEGTEIGDSGNTSFNFRDFERPRTAPAVIVSDIAENIPVIEERIKLIDVPERQILIEALVLNVDDNTSKQLGIMWSGLDSLGASASWTKTVENNRSRVHVDNYRARNYANTTLDRSDAGTTRTWNRGSEASFNGDAWGTGNYPLGSLSTADGAGHGLASSIGAGIADVSEHIKGSLFSGIVGPFDLAATLNLVRENGESQVLASPVIVMGDHTESLIRIGTAIPVPITKSTNRDTGSSSYTDYEVEWIQVMSGHTLWVCPEITTEGDSVRLSVHPQVTEAEEDKNNWSIARDGSMYPVVYTRELDTRVTVPSGQTLLLGGLIQSSNVETHHKIWLLGDIPLLGRLFRWDTTSKVRRNLIILIRPTILDDEAPDTGFEQPSLKMIEPLEKGVGRDMTLPEKDKTLENNEKAVIRLFKREKDGETVEVNPVPAE